MIYYATVIDDKVYVDIEHNGSYNTFVAAVDDNEDVEQAMNLTYYERYKALYDAVHPIIKDEIAKWKLTIKTIEQW